MKFGLKTIWFSLMVVLSISCHAQNLIRFEVVKGSGVDELRTCSGEVTTSNDGLIVNYKVLWDNNAGIKNYDFILNKNGTSYTIVEANTNEEMWTMDVNGDSIAIKYKNNQIAQGEIIPGGFDIKYTDGTNLLFYKREGNRQILKIKKDDYIYSSVRGGLRRFFLPEEGVVVSERKVHGWDTQISESADYGLLSYKVRGIVKKTSPMNAMLNSVVFTRCFFDEVYPFVVGVE
jgi:hypothetical protein